MKINPQTDALIVIDPQIDFCPGGALAVEGGNQIMRLIADYAEQFRHVVITQDWHPAGHKSFASAHGTEPFSQTRLSYGEQTLWPDHCVENTFGSRFHPLVKGAVNRASAIIRKGTNPEVDSYSAFFENDKVTSTGLGGYLQEKGISRVFFVGLAYDFCVGYSALDARRFFVPVYVVKDLTRAIGMPVDLSTVEVQGAQTRKSVLIEQLKDNAALTTVEVMEEQFRQNAVKIINASEVEA